MSRATLAGIVAVVLAGCSRPALEPAQQVVIAPDVAQPEVAPMPRLIPDDPHWMARMEWHRSSHDPVLRDLARGHIQAGDDIEAIIRNNPHYAPYRRGDYVVLNCDYGQSGVWLAAKDGKLIFALTHSCVYQDVFIDHTTEADRDEFLGSFGLARRARVAATVALPAVVGIPASLGAWSHPKLVR